MIVLLVGVTAAQMVGTYSQQSAVKCFVSILRECTKLHWWTVCNRPSKLWDIPTYCYNNIIRHISPLIFMWSTIFVFQPLLAWLQDGCQICITWAYERALCCSKNTEFLLLLSISMSLHGKKKRLSYMMFQLLRLYGTNNRTAGALFSMLIENYLEYITEENCNPKKQKEKTHLLAEEISGKADT